MDIATLFNSRSVTGAVVFGIPNEALAGAAVAIAALVGGLKFLGGKKPAEPKRHSESGGGVPAGKHTDLEDMVGKTSATKLPSPEDIEEEEDAGMSVETGSLESLLARPIDEAPSIGPEEKTDVESGLGLVKFEESPAMPPQPKVPVEMKAPEKPEQKPIPTHAKDLARLHRQFGEEFDVDEMGDIVAVPKERPKYVPPKDMREKAKREAEAKRPVKLYNQPPGKRKENLNRYCMLQYDAGVPPKKVETLLCVKGVSRTSAKQLAFRTYKIWIEKREPLIRGIKEIRELIKRIEYKYLKRQIDEKTRKETLNDANRKLAELEAKLKGSEDYFA